MPSDAPAPATCSAASMLQARLFPMRDASGLPRAGSLRFTRLPGAVLLARHLYQSSDGGATLCPLEGHARIVGGSATPHLARSLAHKYANTNARAVVRDLEENHGRKLAPSYIADVAAAVAGAAGDPVVENNAHAPQSPPAEVASLVLSLDGTCALFCEEGFKQCRRP